MALAGRVPGVSGGTVAFIMGFYHRLIGSVHDLVFGRLDEKKSALIYLAKLGVGWAAVSSGHIDVRSLRRMVEAARNTRRYLTR